MRKGFCLFIPSFYFFLFTLPDFLGSLFFFCDKTFLKNIVRLDATLHDFLIESFIYLLPVHFSVCVDSFANWDAVLPAVCTIVDFCCGKAITIQLLQIAVVIRSRLAVVLVLRLCRLD